MSQTGKALDLPADPLIGHALGGKYTIKKLIGRGGVGLVYLAEDREREREVVVKVLAPNWSNDDEALARFEREAKRLSGLKHPNIVTMYDYGKESRRAYLVMEYLRGELLSDYVDRHRRLTLEQFVPIAAQILKGIGHAHSREMMVRDIKPANIMLCERKGRANFVKILDFGLAKLTKGEQAITEEHVMGTVGYLSPEQIRGEEIDLRVDVYALGVLFYYMLSGRLPFEGENNATVFYKTINEPPRRLSEILTDDRALPEGLVDLIHSCLAKDRDERPGNADEIVEGLIDVVPAAMFRLPRAETARHGVPASMPPGHGNTGMMELLGTEVSPSSKHNVDSGLVEATDPRLVGHTTGQVTQVDTGASAPIPLQTGAHTGQFAPVQTGRTAMMMVAGAFLAVLGGGLAVWLMTGDDDKPGEVAATGTPPAAVGAPAGNDVDPTVVEAALATADRLIGEGDFDGATNELDAVRGLTKALPTLAGRIERADQRIAIGRLMAAGSKFEDEDKRDAAIEAYRDALELDPSYLPAREALARLDVETPNVGGDDLVLGEVAIESRPAAKLYVDGNPAGTTPFTGKLAVGKHEIRLMARGYYNYNAELDVQAEGNTPIAVTMKGRTGGSSKGSSKGSTEDAEPVETPTQTEKPSSSKGSPFLPTKDKTKKSSGPFLPTKDD
ncbi:MAG: serine/threonine protein kinase [Myxococcales bacterium]|nr:serine/threonine protein kinase [Myxococcales bacterium]MCB9718584.1 serine/threonine protein kinase [Myxococcales bacterium]